MSALEPDLLVCGERVDVVVMDAILPRPEASSPLRSADRGPSAIAAATI